MLEAGAIIKVQLPGQQGLVTGHVVACSKAGRSCKLRLGDGDEVTVNVSKCAFTVVPPGGVEVAQLADGKANGAAEAVELHEEEDSDDDMDAFKSSGVCADALDSLTAAVAEDPSTLLQPSAQVADLARSAAKVLFEYAAKLASSAASKDAGLAGSAAGAPSGQQPAQAAVELYVDGFDAEQIWLQLDMAAAPALKRARRQLRKAGDVPRLVPTDVEEALDELLAGSEGDKSEEEKGSEPASDDDDLDSEGDYGAGADLEGVDYDAMLAKGAGREPSSEDNGSSEEEEEDSEEEAAAAAEEAGGGRKRRRLTNAEARAAVEDDFMKLDEMEAFLLQAERQAADENDSASGSDADLDDDDLDGSRAEREQRGAAGGSGESEDMDDDALDPEGAEDESEDDDLDAMLENAAALAGRKRSKAQKRKRVRFGDESDDDDEDEDDEPRDLGDDPLANATYEDFFGPRKVPGRGGAAGRQHDGSRRGQATRHGVLAVGSDEEEESEEEGGHVGIDYADYMAELRAAGKNADDGGEDGGGAGEESAEEEEEDEFGRPLGTSTHERRLARTAQRARQLEADAMGEREWYLRGEVEAGRRPKNSALEVDIDFDTTVRPPPAPTEETTKSLDELIKARIAEGRFDDVVRIAAAAPERKRTVVELDDKKSAAGLAELYEKDYVQAVTGSVDDKDEEVRQLAQAQYAALAARLDQLSHSHYRPVPSIEEVTVKVDVPAILMEEAAPQFVSAASMRAPEEVYRAGGLAAAAKAAAKAAAEGGEGEEGAAAVGGVLQPGGVYKSEAELSREDRRRRRATKKRTAKKRKASREAERAERAVSQGGDAPVAGRKSAAMEEEARKMEKAAKKSGLSGRGGRGEFTKSKAVFGRIQAHRDGGGAAAAAAKAAAASTGPPGTQFKL